MSDSDGRLHEQTTRLRQASEKNGAVWLDLLKILIALVLAFVISIIWWVAVRDLIAIVTTFCDRMLTMVAIGFLRACHNLICTLSVGVSWFTTGGDIFAYPPSLSLIGAEMCKLINTGPVVAPLRAFV